MMKKRALAFVLAVLTLIAAFPFAIFADRSTAAFTRHATYYYDPQNPNSTSVHGKAAYAYDCYVKETAGASEGAAFVFFKDGKPVRDKGTVKALTEMYFANSWQSIPKAVEAVTLAKEFIEITKSYRLNQFVDGLTSVAAKCLGTLGAVYLTGGTATGSGEIVKTVASQSVEELKERFLDISNVMAKLHISLMHAVSDDLERTLAAIRDTDWQGFIHYKDCKAFSELFSRLERLVAAESVLVSGAIEELDPSFIGNIAKYFGIAANSFVGDFSELLEDTAKLLQLKKENPAWIADAIELAFAVDKIGKTVEGIEDIKALYETADASFHSLFHVFKAYTRYQSLTYTSISVLSALYSVTLSNDFAENPEKEPTPSSDYVSTHDTKTAAEGLYRIRNSAGGRFLNVYAGKNADGVNVVTWEADGTVDQLFYIKYVSKGRYLIYAVCSEGSSGYTRCLDVYTGSANKLPSAGDTIDIYKRSSIWNDAQYFYLEPMADGSFVIECASVGSLVVTASAPSKNNGDVCIKPFENAPSQKWELISEPAKEKPSDIPKGSDFSEHPVIRERLDEVFSAFVPGQSFFTKNGKACACHNDTSFSCVTNTASACHCLRYPEIDGKKVDLKAVQCLGYARYVQQVLFQCHEANSESFQKLGGVSGKLSAANTRAWFEKNREKLHPGTHIRVYGSGHSVVLLGVDYEKGNVTYVQTNWTSQSENSGKWCSVNAVTTSTFARFAEQYATLDYAYVYRGYREAFSEATDPIPEENPLPEEDHGRLLTTESVSAYMQTRGVGALKDFRVIFVCSEAVLYRFEELKVSVTFSLEDGSVKSYHGTLGINADDFTLTRTVHAGDALFQADEGCLLFGKAIVDIPADTVDRVTVTLRDTGGTVVFSGGISFEK